jgi:hypothetical protein
MSRSVDPGVIGFLLASEPWTRYRTRKDLLGEGPATGAGAVMGDRAAMLAHPLVQELIDDVAGWPGGVLERHDKATLPMHKLVQLAEMGVDRSEVRGEAAGKLALARISPEGPPEILINIPRAFGGMGEDIWTWLICDAPVTLYALARMGWADDPRVRAGVVALAALARDGGWPCAGSQGIGKFHGPGSRQDPCPIANMLMLRLLSCFDGFESEKAMGVECLLDLWARSRQRAPYMFRMGTDFRKLKAPTLWYGLLSVADVVSRHPAAVGDERFADMVRVIEGKADADGRFVPESVYLAWKGWDFGQKKEPSGWLTFLATRVIARAGA